MKPIRGFGDVDEFITSLRAPDFVGLFALLVEANKLMPLGTKKRGDWIMRAGLAISEAQKLGMRTSVREERRR
jgi:hypothetical protein